MTLEVPKMAGSVLSAEATLADRTIAAHLDGTADNESRAELDVFIKVLHAEAVRLAVQLVEIDVRKLEFMNSSCFKIFVSWLAQLRDLETAAQYRVKIRSNPKLLWQRRSLAALSCFAVDLVIIDT